MEHLSQTKQTMNTTIPAARRYAIRVVKFRLAGLRFWSRPIIEAADCPTQAIRQAIVCRRIPAGQETVATLTHLYK